jgi:hypothetical protein
VREDEALQESFAAKCTEYTCGSNDTARHHEVVVGSTPPQKGMDQDVDLRASATCPRDDISGKSAHTVIADVALQQLIASRGGFCAVLNAYAGMPVAQPSLMPSQWPRKRPYH